MNPQEVLKIVSSVRDKTVHGSLSWSKYGPTEDEYTTESTNFHYYIGSRDDDGQLPLRFQVWKKKDPGPGATIVAEYVTSVSDADTVAALQELHSLARASSAGVSGSVTDAVLRDLGELF